MSYPSDDRTPIKDLSVGRIQQPFLVTGASVGETKTGSPYLKATLADKTGELTAIKWDTAEAPAPGVYLVTGLVEEYQGRLQCKISALEASDGDVGEFVKASSFGKDELVSTFDVFLEGLQGEVGDVVRCIFSDGDLRERFFISPASSSNHHGYRHGLLEHTVSMAGIAHEVAKHYAWMYGEGSVDRDLLVAGAILHDLGKVFELEEDGFEWTYGAEGLLVGHIAECVTLLHDACMATLASERTRRRLIHLVLSHHGRLEYGSPVPPRLLEAQILHLVDMMDSRFAMFREATDGLEVGQLSEWVRPLGGRVVR